MKFNKQYIILIIIVISLFIGTDLEAQCSMCKANVESNDELTGGDTVEGLNNGILYILALPYLLLLTGGYFLYKHFVKNETN